VGIKVELDHEGVVAPGPDEPFIYLPIIVKRK
jgi:hypothetical protein